MTQPIIIIGIGEMGGVFARGFLRLGHPVYPVTRDLAPEKVVELFPEPVLVLLAVAENDLQPALATLPKAWRERLVLLQNELLPPDWERHGLTPTVISVWFEKKKGQDVKVLVPSPVYGPQADLVAAALGAIDIPTRVLRDHAELLFELVRKNLYIVSTNVAGLRTGGTVDELRRHHQVFLHEVAHDVLDIQEHLTGQKLSWERLIEAVMDAFDGDPEHKCMGRSAPARLARALGQANAASLEVPTLRGIAREIEP